MHGKLKKIIPTESWGKVNVSVRLVAALLVSLNTERSDIGYSECKSVVFVLCFYISLI